MYPDDDQARELLSEALETMDRYYKERGIFQNRSGFGASPALVVVDFAYGWTDESYAGGTARLDSPVEATRQLLDVVRNKKLPIIYTTSPFRNDDWPSEASADYRQWDARACRIDERVAPCTGDHMIEKDHASAFSGTNLNDYLMERGVDTLLIAGCSTSACVRATAMDAQSLKFGPVIVGECVGDRSAVAHIFTLFDIQSRFCDVQDLRATIEYLQTC